MTLLYKIKRLIKADAHAVVEGLEEPKWILAQAIRDMEAELETLAALFAEKKASSDKLAKKIQSTQKLIRTTDEDIELAIEEKREDLAKSLIKKLLLNQKNLELFIEQSGHLESEIERLEKELSEKRQSFDHICARSETVTFAKSQDVVFDEAQQLVQNQSHIEHDVELEFLKRLKKHKGGKNEK